MEKYTSTIMAERIVVNKHYNNSANITPDKFLYDGEIIISNEYGFEGIYIINSRGEVVRIGNVEASGTTISEDVKEWLREHYMSSAATIDSINNVKGTLSAVSVAIRNELQEHIADNAEKFDEVDGRLDALEQSSGSSQDFDEERVREIAAEEAAKFSGGSVSEDIIRNIAGEVASEEVAKIVASADSSFDTLKEIADWIINDGAGAADLVSNLNELSAGTVGIEERVSESLDDFATDIEELSASTVENGLSITDISAYTQFLKEYIDSKAATILDGSDHVMMSQAQYAELIDKGVVMLDGQPHLYDENIYYCLYASDEPYSGSTPSEGGSYTYDEETGMVNVPGDDIDDGFLLIDESMIDEDGFILLGSNVPTPTPPAPDEEESTIDGDMVDAPSMSIDDEGIMDVPYGLEMVLE